jgi:PIN domain nuclease of toxin-antitoxin system
MDPHTLILLDTATWIWLTSDIDRLSPTARETIEAHDERLVSSISAWEVGMLVAKGRIRLDRPTERWVDEALRANGVTPVPVDHRIGVLSTQLPAEPPPDPADRMIIASVLRSGALLVTPDQSILDYPYCPAAW